MISVVIPAFNEEKRIERSLIALSNQTIPRDQYELIVVDGGSHDKTCQIAQDYADLVFVQESERVAGARNDGFLRSRHGLVATTDADSIVAPNWIEQAIGSFSDQMLSYPLDR
jgi:glycosyltransferase involved in cell wall biosynthesis